ncbi:MAG TPA: hypothetical protein VK054_02750, partial [Beutenbergiaceae bacterium]|nr:hypothetical protein [Beutenbergiaceae bacterium]
LNVESVSSEHGARKDTVALAQTLFAGLSGLWMGSGEVGLKRMAQTASSAQELHERAPQAPLDLVRLCYITVSPFEQGPHTPVEFATNLRPWDPLPSHAPATVVSEDFVTGGFTTVTIADQAPISAAETTQIPAIDDDAPPPPQDATPAVSAPQEPPVQGWDLPPHAEPATVERQEPKTVDARGSDSVFTTDPAWDFPEVEPQPHTPEPVEPVQPAQPQPSPGTRFGELKDYIVAQFQPVGEGEDRRFNPAGFVLLAMIALIVFALVLASSSLRSARNFDPDSIPSPDPIVTTPEDDDDSDAADDGVDDDGQDDEEEEEEEEEENVIEIADGVTFDPSTGGGENQDLAYLAFDGDMDTIWRSMRYNSPTYAIKEGIAFSVVLEEEATVSEVILHVQGEGGQVEVRAGDPSNPTSGEVLASGSMSSQTTLTFDEPVETDTIVLWFPELPVAESDGMNRIELAEVELK